MEGLEEEYCGLEDVEEVEDVSFGFEALSSELSFDEVSLVPLSDSLFDTVSVIPVSTLSSVAVSESGVATIPINKSITPKITNHLIADFFI